MMLESLLMAACAAIVTLLGVAHLAMTLHGESFHPRDETLREQMAKTSPRLTRDTSMWNAWIGFNASHSYGAILFGLIYGYLALRHRDLLFADAFLLGLGLLTLVAYLFLALRYWFSKPRNGILAALALYLAALSAHFWT